MQVYLRSSATACSWACSVLALAACTPAPERVVVGRIVIDAPRSFDEEASAREIIRDGVRDRLSRDDTVVFDPQTRDATHVLHLRVTDTAPAAAADRARPQRALHVRLRPVRAAPLFEAVTPAGAGAPAAAMLAAFDEAWAVLVRERRLEVQDDGALIAALADADPRVRDFAIVRLGDRRSAAAVAPLCERLRVETQSDLVLRAIGALVAIGDPRAVEPVIELSKRREPEFVLQIVYAVGAIGGRTAEAYLVTIASGHPVDAVRRGAEQALAEMSRPPRSGARP